MNRFMKTMWMTLGAVAVVVAAGPAGAVERAVGASTIDAAKVLEAKNILARVRAQVIAHPPDRKQQAQVARTMKGLGAAGFEPLLAIVTNGETGVSASAHETLMVGALEALGKLRDRRSVEVLAQLVESDREGSSAVVRAAAQSLGMMCEDQDLAVLARASSPGARWEREALSGFRGCRRAPAARHLSARLLAHPAADVAKEVAQSMGYLGSTWAWEAMGPARAQEGRALRAELEQSLLAAQSQYSGEARQAVSDALQMIEFTGAKAP